MATPTIQDRGSTIIALEFVKQYLPLFDGPKVTIYVGPEKKAYQLPKALICYHSTFFNAAFNGGFKEGVEQTMMMEEDCIAAFDMLLQFLYTGCANPQETCIQEKIMGYLQFFRLVDKVDLIGSLTVIIQEFKKIFIEESRVDGSISSISYVRREELLVAFDLPRGHEARQVIVDVCVEPYFQSLASGAAPFQCQKELVDVIGFAEELLAAVGKAISQRSVWKTEVRSLNPLSGYLFRF